MVSRPAGRVTVRDIAAQTGVSIATVSRVLNGQVHVAPETRELVQQAAERLRARGPGSRTGSARATQDAVYLRCPYILTDYFGLIVALAAASERGLRVPEDLSITGFDDIDLAQATSPMLTTVRQPLAEMGRMAVSLLIRLLDGHQVDALHVELATDLIVRGSTGPA